MTVLGGQRHAPHRPLKQPVRTDSVGGGRDALLWVGGWVGGRAAGEGKGRRANSEGGVVVVVVEGSSVEVS